MEFTFGWEMPGNPIQPGSTTVRVELEPTAEGTRVVLTHSGLPGAEAVAQHRHGWEHYLPRLAERAMGGDPGPDPAVIGIVDVEAQVRPRPARGRGRPRCRSWCAATRRRRR